MNGDQKSFAICFCAAVFGIVAIVCASLAYNAYSWKKLTDNGYTEQQGYGTAYTTWVAPAK